MNFHKIYKGEMEYVKLDDEWKERLKEKDLSGWGFDRVIVELENGQTIGAELINGKKLKLAQKIKVEKIEEIHVL